MSETIRALMSIPMISGGMAMMSELTEKNKEMKEKAIADYKHALKLPRKQKKLAKKRANIDYSIACYFDDIWGNDFEMISRLF